MPRPSSIRVRSGASARLPGRYRGPSISPGSQRLNHLSRQNRPLQSDEPCRRWHSAQFMRYLVETRSQSLGVNAYEARRGADLMVAAAGDPELRKRLQRLLQYWDPGQLTDLFHDTWATLLAQHPLISARRIQPRPQLSAPRNSETSSKLRWWRSSDRRLWQLTCEVSSCIASPSNSSSLSSIPVMGTNNGYWRTRSCPSSSTARPTTSSLSARLGPAAMAHAWCPDELRRVARPLVRWVSRNCPNADKDLTIQRFWNTPERHLGWRSLDPNDFEAMQELAAQLALRGTDSVRKRPAWTGCSQRVTAGKG